MDKAKQKEIIDKLEEKGANQPCPRCGNNSFTVLDGYLNPSVQDDLGGFVIGGQSIPTAVTACTNCGYLAQHALGVLGLLEKQGE